MNNKELIKHIKTYTTYEWLIFIKILENTSDTDLLKIEPNQLERSNLKNSNWYSKLLDLALRLSDYEKIKLNKMPKKKDYREFLKLYLRSYDAESSFKTDLDYSFNLAFAKCTYEQLKNYAPPVNDMGRLIELYKDKEALFKQFFGLTPKQILYFYMLNKDDTTLIVESKLLHIDENIILNSSVIELESRFKKIINDALKQIDLCFKKIDVQNKYKYDFLDNVMIISVIDYEVMIHNTFEKIIEYLKSPNTKDKSLYFEQRNSFLEAGFLNLKNDLIKNFKEDKNE